MNDGNDDLGHIRETVQEDFKPARKRKSRAQIEEVWVIGVDYGTEGKKEPHMAFLTEQQAQQAKVIAEGPYGADSAYIARVPVWKP